MMLLQVSQHHCSRPRNSSEAVDKNNPSCCYGSEHELQARFEVLAKLLLRVIESKDDLVHELPRELRGKAVTDGKAMGD